MSQRKKWSPNPSKIPAKVDDSVLKRLAREEGSYKFRRKLLEIGGIDNLPLDFGVCWACWIRITGEGLNNWRVPPYSVAKPHEEVCPLCGRTNWRGRVWYPKRYLIDKEVGNPSRRENAPKKEEKKKNV